MRFLINICFVCSFLALSSAWAPTWTKILPNCRKLVNGAVSTPRLSGFAASNQNLAIKAGGGIRKRSTQFRMAGYVEQVDSEQFEIALQVMLSAIFKLLI
jgi:hypothetical protein